MGDVRLLVVVFAAFAVESTLGFGATVVTVALGALFMAPAELLPAFVPVNVALSAYLTLRYRRHVAGRTLTRRILPPMLLGLPLGVLAFRRLDAGTLRMAFGVLVIALAILELVRASGDVRPPGARRPVLEVALLFVAGVVHGAFATGGPLVVYVASKALSEKEQFRATLSALWLGLNATLLVSYAWSGGLTRSSLAVSASLVVPLALGTLVGEWAHRRVPVGAFRVGVYVVLLLAGVALVVPR